MGLFIFYWLLHSNFAHSVHLLQEQPVGFLTDLCAITSPEIKMTSSFVFFIPLISFSCFIAG